MPTSCRHAHDQPTPIQLVLCLSRFMVNTAAIVQRLEHRDTWRQAVRDPCCRSCSSSQHGEKLQSMTKLDKTHKTVILGDFRHNTTINSIWNDQENTWPRGSWEFVEKIFSIWRHETDMKSKVKINMLQPLSYSLPLHCSSFVQAFLCFNNPWATSIPIDLDWSGRTNQVGLQVLSEGNMQRCYTANKHFRFVFWSLKHVWAFLNLWECMALSTVQGTLSESTLDIHGQQPAIRHLCWQKKVRYRERIRCGNANIVYACYRSFWLVSRL